VQQSLHKNTNAYTKAESRGLPHTTLCLYIYVYVRAAAHNTQYDVCSNTAISHIQLFFRVSQHSQTSIWA